MPLEISIKIFSISLLFALISGAVSQLYQFIPMLYEDYTDYVSILTTWSPVISIVLFIINPVAILVAFYRIGKKYDLHIKIREAIISIILGGGIGYFLTFVGGLLISYYVFHATVYYDPLSTFGLLLASFYQAIPLFFVTFASLALGYLRREHPAT